MTLGNGPHPRPVGHTLSINGDGELTPALRAYMTGEGELTPVLRALLIWRGGWTLALRAHVEGE